MRFWFESRALSEIRAAPTTPFERAMKVANDRPDWERKWKGIREWTRWLKGKNGRRVTLGTPNMLTLLHACKTNSL